MIPVFVKDGVQFKPKNPQVRERESPELAVPYLPPPIPEPILEIPDHEVEDPLNLLGSDDELEAEGTKKKKPLLT